MVSYSGDELFKSRFARKGLQTVFVRTTNTHHSPFLCLTRALSLTPNAAQNRGERDQSACLALSRRKQGSWLNKQIQACVVRGSAEGSASAAEGCRKAGKQRETAFR